MNAKERKEYRAELLAEVEKLTEAQRRLYEKNLAAYMQGLKSKRVTEGAISAALGRALNDTSLVENAHRKAAQRGDYAVVRRVDDRTDEPRYYALPKCVLGPEDNVIEAVSA